MIMGIVIGRVGLYLYLEVLYIYWMSLKGRHTSLDTHVKRNIAWIERIPSVTKVVLGFSESCRHRYPPGHIRIRSNVRGGFKINAYSGNGVTDIFIKIEPIEDRDAVVALIKQRFGDL
jgi:hypothetical protein